MAGAVVELTEQNFQQHVVTSSKPALVDMWAAWCGPCRMVAPEIRKVAERQAGRCLVVKVNTDELGDLGERFGIPTPVNQILTKLIHAEETSRSHVVRKMK